MSSSTRQWSMPALTVLAFLAFAWFPTSADGLPEGVTAEAYVDSMKFPTALAPAGDDEILVVEKLGGVRLVRDGKLLEEPVAELRVATQNEAGLIGVAPMPDYESSGEFLVTQTPQDDPEHRYVSKLKLEGDTAIVVDKKWLELPGRKGADRHFGGALDFSSDGHLYVGLGELAQKERAQDTDDLSGSILRYNADGSIPEDNPIDGSPIYAYGFRNPFGLTVDSDDTVWVADNGADAADEINRIEAGKNYGWPKIEGRCDYFPRHEPCDRSDEFQGPAYEYTAVVSPTGLTEYDAELMPDLQGQLLVGGWHNSWVHRFEIKEDGTLDHMPPLFRFDEEDHGHGDHSHRDTSSFTDIAVGHDGGVLALESGRKVGRIIRIAPGDDDNGGGVGSGSGSGHGHGTDGHGHDHGGESGESGCSAGGAGGPVGWWGLLVAIGVAARRRDA